MDKPIRNVVVVGGGTAGWLTACTLAAASGASLAVTLIESPDVAAIGVGEGTWPTIRHTFETIGLSETELLLCCDASFKQGSRFDGWRDGTPGDRYYHPFVPPAADPGAVAALWRDQGKGAPFAYAAGPQPHICDLNLAPRQRAMPDYAGALNYAYHLDAAKLAALLKRHATQRLGVRHIAGHVTGVAAAGNGDIDAVETRDHGRIDGDLFIDCSGQAALLIGGHCGARLIDRGMELFNDRALAVQVPVPPDSAIASVTAATAHAAGWTWDIGLPTRRGIGCVYSSAHLSDDAALDQLHAYLRRTAPGTDPAALSPRLLSFRSGHRDRFWAGNCLAIGQAAGFLEPLEASAIVMIELALETLVRSFPRTRTTMDLHARQFNALFRYRWDRIVDFLKLHYVLSRRDEPYWRDHRDEATICDRLRDLIGLWADRAPSDLDLPQVHEVFPAASYAYVLYGMGFAPPPDGLVAASGRDGAIRALSQAGQRGRALAAGLVPNRAYLDALRDTQSQSMETVN
jgi:hypothetical protein